MAAIVLSERDLMARTNSLHSVFAPLREGRARVALGRASDSPGGATAIVAADESASNLRYRGESFRTSVPALRCRYFELWRSASNGKLVLDRAYFTLLKVVPASSAFSELLALHADPGDEVDLKQGPHLHLSCAPEPFPHCHFPMEFGFLKMVLRDADSLTSAIERSIGVIARDVLPRFNE